MSKGERSRSFWRYILLGHVIANYAGHVGIPMVILLGYLMNEYVDELLFSILRVAQDLSLEEGIASRLSGTQASVRMRRLSYLIGMCRLCQQA